MSFVDGLNLERAAYQGKLKGVGDVLYVTRQIGEILLKCHLHKSTIFHRDLRPSNVMISGGWHLELRDSEIVILDFDLSWHSGANDLEYILTDAEALGYLAPEQLNARSRFSTRSALVDVFGLAMLLYFLLSREHPVANVALKSEWPREIRSKMASAYTPNWKSVPERLARLIEACTQEEQSRRPHLKDVISQVSEMEGMVEGGVPLIIESWIEELFARLFNKSYSYENNEFNASVTGGNKYRARADYRTDSIHLNFSVMTGESANRRNIGQNLGKMMEDSVAHIAKFGERMAGTVVRVGELMVEFRVRVPKSVADLDMLVKNITKVQKILSSDLSGR